MHIPWLGYLLHHAGDVWGLEAIADRDAVTGLPRDYQGCRQTSSQPGLRPLAQRSRCLAADNALVAAVGVRLDRSNAVSVMSGDGPTWP